MRPKLLAAVVLTTLLCAVLPALAANAKKEARFEIQLLWGTDLAKSPDTKHKPVEPDVERKLKSLPLKFKNYFLVSKNVVVVTIGQTQKVQVSEKCEVELKNVDNLKFELAFFGKGKQTAKRSQDFPLGEMLIHGGNAPGSNAWLVVVKRIE